MNDYFTCFVLGFFSFPLSIVLLALFFRFLHHFIKYQEALLAFQARYKAEQEE